MERLKPIHETASGEATTAGPNELHLRYRGHKVTPVCFQYCESLLKNHKVYQCFKFIFKSEH